VTVITDAEEIAHYNEVAASHDKYVDLRSKVQHVLDLQTSWAVPLTSWLDTTTDGAAQADVYIHLSRSIVGGRVLQLGGTGQAALKMLAGGAAHAVLLTPSEVEARLAERVADELGLADRFTTAIGFAESIPLDDESVTAVISEGCLHHTDTTEAFRECFRVLVTGGRFGAFDPWKARLYTLGTQLVGRRNQRVFGKRDKSVNCRPIDRDRLVDLAAVFPVSEVRLHGAITRYPSIVWGRYGNPLSVAAAYRMTRVDDRISSQIPALARNGSSCAVLATKWL
jgi:SAM-dependent methyltransferase